MEHFVLDASAILRFADNEAGVDRVAELAKLAARNQVELHVSAVNWGEVILAHLRAYGSQDNADMMRSVLPFQLRAADEQQCERAAHVRYRYKVPYADAFVAVLADELSATLVTADYDFEKMGRNLKIEFLPAKP